MAVVGGGLAGLVAAYELAQAGCRTVLVERETRLGGQIFTQRLGGFVVEHGAEGYSAARAAPEQLCRQLGLGARVVQQRPTSSLVARQGRLVAIPSSQAARLVGIQGLPSDLGRGLRSLAGGMGELVEALVAAIREQVTWRLGTAAIGLDRQGATWRLRTSGEPISARAVLLALPAQAAARLLERVAEPASELLSQWRCRSTVSVSLAYSRSAVAHPLDAAGLVAETPADQEGFRACSFASSLFPARAPDGTVLLRAFFRPGTRYPLEAPDADWVAEATAVLGPLLGAGAPLQSWVARWPETLPRYDPGHAQRLQALVEVLRSDGPAIELAGAAYAPAGVAGAVESARAAARRLVAVSGLR